MSVSAAEFIFTWANIIGVGALSVGVLCAALIFVTANIKEKEFKRQLSDSAIEVSAANLRIAQLDNETEHLKADNLTLQKVMMARHIGIVGFDGPPRAEVYFSGIEKFPGTVLVIQPADDPEALNLANEIAIAVAVRGGWKPQIIDGKRSGVPSAAIGEGVRVSYPVGKPWTTKEPNQPWIAWHNAAEVLADALTKAGLGIGDIPVDRFGFSNDPAAPSGQFAHFEPSLEGVYVQVGPRPISLTIQWMEQQRGETAP